MGVTLGDPGKGGITIYEVEAKGPADQAGLKAGDVILTLDGRPTQTDTAFRDALSTKQPGDRVDVVYSRDGKQAETKVFVMPEAVERKGGRGFGGGGGWDDRIPRAWRKPTYKLAILGVEYPDVKHNAKIKDSDWEESMFSIGTYTGKNATGAEGLRQHERLLQGAELRDVQDRRQVRRLGRGVEEADGVLHPAAAPARRRRRRS